MKYCILLILFLSNVLFSNTYPNKNIEFVVGFGQGGSSDRMTRNMTPFIEEVLQEKITVRNIKDTQKAANYVLNQKADGYTVFSSAFFPHLLNTIINEKANYILDDFAIINLQWFDYEFIAVDKNSPFNTIIDILDHIKNKERKLSIGVVNKSTGHLIIKLLLEKLNIPFEKINLVIYKGGRKARKAIGNTKIDVLIIAAQGSEKYRKDIKPIAIAALSRSKRWDAPTLNEALKETGIQIPIFNGSIRGLIVSKKFKEKFPHRFKTLEKAIKKTLAKRKVQKQLKEKRIGYTWLGSEKSSKIMEESYQLFKKYSYLVKD